jgi:hypothetical protein
LAPVKSDIERKAALDQETYKQEIRQGILSEYERRMNAERDHHARIARAQIEEIGKLKAELETLKRKIPKAETPAPVATAEIKLQDLQKKMDQMRREKPEMNEWMPDPVSIPTPPPFRMEQ